MGCASSRSERTKESSVQEQQRQATVSQWLEKQRSGEVAGSQPTLGGAEMQRIYERYLESFTHPIPDQFEVENATSDR
ncbi:DUF3613 domain-containing protein [uncultured Halovibrio sp.]|uniref:DUF3613 domain-containing protein n=1 Tax=uncultured Halovibrio sp. TaxID=985049 RepID=UPI0025FBF129|nr:DUF3613 domain-containing protein [uncultured Halovibrio sp.]